MYTVWVGGVEVTDNYVEFREAVRLYEYYSSRGYDDVIVQFEKWVVKTMPDLRIGHTCYN